MDPKFTIFESSSIYQSWTFDPKKCVFDRFLGERRRYVFAKVTDPVISTDRGCLDCATQKVCHRRCCTVAKRPKIRPRRRRRRTHSRTHVFKRRPHKMPFGQILFNHNSLWVPLGKEHFECLLMSVTTRSRRGRLVRN